MYLLHALFFIFLIKLNEGKIKGKRDERTSEKCASVENGITEKSVFPFDVFIPRGRRSVWKSKELKTRKIFQNKKNERGIRNCSECGVIFRGNNAFEEHVFSRHEGMKLMPCEKCDMKFLKLEALYDHARVWHKGGNKCKFCKKICPLEALEEHEEMCMKTGNKIEVKELEREWMSPTYCGLCDRKFPSYTSYKKHCRTSHPREKLFPCRFCLKRFASGNYLCLHMEEHHADEMAKAGEKLWKCRRGLAYSCPYCEVVVKGIKKYERHGKNYHPGQAMFECVTCGRGFGSKKSADRHAREIHGEDKTCCRYCSKCYSRPDRMKEHEEACCRKRAVVEERKVRALNNWTTNNNKNKDRMGRHHCDICNRTMYMLDDTFKRHVLTHEDYDYCDMCDDRFERERYPDGLGKHMKMRHPLRNNVDALLETVRSSGVKFEDVGEIEKSDVLEWSATECMFNFHIGRFGNERM